MKFGLVHRVMTDALAALGLLSLVTSGELDRYMSVLIVLGLIAAVVIPERLQDDERLRKFGVLGSLSLLALQLTRLFLGGDVLQLAVEFAAGLQVIRLATRRGAAHDQQIILLALLHLVAGTVLGGGLAYGLCFLGFLVVAPGALVLSHLRREVEGNYRQGARDRTGLPVDVPRILRSRRVISKRFLAVTCSLAIPIFFFTAVLFVAFPRVGLSLLLLNHSRSSRMIGFSDRVDLGNVGKLRSDPAIAMRVFLSDPPSEPPPRLALYLRGTAFDSYDGRSWSRTQTGRYPATRHGSMYYLRPYDGAVSERSITIDLEPIDPPVVFLPPDTVQLKVLDRGDPVLGHRAPLFTGPEGSLRYTPDERGIRYQTYQTGDAPLRPRVLSPGDRDRYLAVPASLTTRIADLARRWTRDADTSLAKAEAIEKHLRDEYQYDLASPSGAADDPLDHFLFESRRGHCEFYSTAMAMMLRTLGVPTRNVTGFIGGTYNRFGGFYAVRQGDAHSWVEAFVEGRGWRRFDPTPPASSAPRAEIDGFLAFIRDFVEAAAQRWNHHVIGYDLDQQVRLLRSVSRRYAQITGRTGFFSAGSSRRVFMVVGGVVFIALGIYFYRRRRPRGGRRPDDDAASEAAIAVVDLYRALEAAMAARGAPRPPGTPPTAHARALKALGHPIGDEVADLTRIYIDVRFGDRPLTERQRLEFAARVKALRQAPPAGEREEAA